MKIEYLSKKKNWMRLPLCSVEHDRNVHARWMVTFNDNPEQPIYLCDNHYWMHFQPSRKEVN